VECVRLLIENGESPRSQDRPDGLTPLHAAILGGHTNCVQECIDHGAELSEVDRWGRTVVHIAVLANNTATLTWLAQTDVSFQQADKNGVTPLHLAAFSGAYVGSCL
jgi:ankyrin repeat protein